MLSVIETFGDELPASCRDSCEKAWIILDPFIAKYASVYDVCERTSRLLRIGLGFFGSSALPVVSSILSRMAAAFESTSFASFVRRTTSQTHALPASNSSSHRMPNNVRLTAVAKALGPFSVLSAACSLYRDPRTSHSTRRRKQ